MLQRRQELTKRQLVRSGTTNANILVLHAQKFLSLICLVLLAAAARAAGIREILISPKTLRAMDPGALQRALSAIK
jgi:hypothetical protein